MVMLLYLARHGDAKFEDEDPERHLSDRGLEEVKKTADFLGPLNIGVGAVWHSGKARAAQTAEILASALTVKDGVVKQRGMAPLDPVDPIRQELMARHEDLMIVGHLPFLANLASTLLAGPEGTVRLAFEQSAVLCLERSGEQSWSVRWMVAPWMI
jgi:phosphohistidine phosphatase